MKISMKREQNSACIGSAEREKFGAKLKTKNIFKALALAMLMPAMLLTTACSNEDNLVNNAANTENTINKGYALPVTVNVTRQSDATTRATFNESTHKLEFSTGDKLFVSGSAGHWVYDFVGTLDYDTESGKFSGTIYISEQWTGTFDELLAAVDPGYDEFKATLLPAGYEGYGFLTIDNDGTDDKYDDSVEPNFTYTLATSKATGVEQFSYEEATEYDHGFALEPQSTILNFTITGLAANTDVAVALKGKYSTYNITRTVTTDASGNATFAAGILGGARLNLFSLTVGGNAITLPTKDAEVGKIYNITRAAPALNPALTPSVKWDFSKMPGTLNLSSGESYTYKGVTLLNIGTGDCTLDFENGEFSGNCQFIVPEGISFYGIVVDFSGIKNNDIHLGDYGGDEMQYVAWPDGGYGVTVAPFSGTAVGLTSITFNFTEPEEE